VEVAGRVRSAVLGDATFICDPDGRWHWSCTPDGYARGTVTTEGPHFVILELEDICVKIVCLTLGCHERLEIVLVAMVEKRRILFRKIRNFDAG
jgi:hypothetical protein